MANLPQLCLKPLQGQEKHSLWLSLTTKLASAPGSLQRTTSVCFKKKKKSEDQMPVWCQSYSKLCWQNFDRPSAKSEQKEQEGESERKREGETQSYFLFQADKQKTSKSRLQIIVLFMRHRTSYSIWRYQQCSWCCGTIPHGKQLSWRTLLWQCNTTSFVIEIQSWERVEVEV